MLIGIVAVAMREECTPLPDTPSAAQEKIAEENILALTLREESGTIIIATPGGDITPDALQDIITPRLQENPDLKVYLRAHKEMKWMKVQQVIQHCLEAGATNIFLQNPHIEQPL